ncbi:quinolinate phosphoribosyl transferase [Clostridium bovifaecis]|uniref:Quinolinate phosphoribosyl transferase n=1 Tax=Clostridium bovifaecis TaxID=2184719 RepID=A0A6I6FGC8_9CLOT|nr:quinolinate phosphoribosyl transferase [Clostridium bovifaecis]
MDVRDVIFKDIIDKEFNAVITPERDGILSGIAQAEEQIKEIGIKIKWHKNEGNQVKKGEPIAVVTADPKGIATAEEKIIGALAKYSGIATATKGAVDSSQGKVRIVAGSWKKMPPEIKTGVRDAVVAGGASFRISTNKMIYIDKNYIRMLGSIPKVLDTVKELTDFTKVIQIKGEQFSIEEETKQALENGCNLLMVDTGNLEDLERCLSVVNELGVRNQVEVAFAGNVKISDMDTYINAGIDVLCIGKEIVDAPLLDMKIDVKYKYCLELMRWD